MHKGYGLKTTDFFYDLPEELIAQHPCKNRDESRLLVVDRKSGNIEHRRFFDISEYLRAGDCLVINDTKVFKARLLGFKDTGAKVELFLLRALGNDEWEALIKPGKRMKPGAKASFGDGAITCDVLGDLGDGLKRVALTYDGDLDDRLNEYGNVPFPHYMKDTLSEEDERRYQTVYARERGSVAAPTAGLHFTETLLSDIEKSGVNIARVTLHVGLGTFRPVKVDDIKDHIMHSEYYYIDSENAARINRAKKSGGRIISVGTTSTRVLESVATKYGKVKADSGSTDIFISPGYEFKAVDALITNFHLPMSTLIMLVSAFYKREEVLEVYKQAVDMKYRFFSFGDAMFLY